MEERDDQFLRLTSGDPPTGWQYGLPKTIDQKDWTIQQSALGRSWTAIHPSEKGDVHLLQEVTNDRFDLGCHLCVGLSIRI